MALEADVPNTDDVRLIGIEPIREDARCALRQIEDIVMPLERREASVVAEPCALRRHICCLDVDPADLGNLCPLHACTERLREELTAETVADDRNVMSNGIAQQRRQRR